MCEKNPYSCIYIFKKIKIVIYLHLCVFFPANTLIHFMEYFFFPFHAKWKRMVVRKYMVSTMYKNLKRMPTIYPVI